MSGQPSQHPRIFWYELAQKWAIRAPALPDQTQANRFTTALRQQCDGVFHHGMQSWLVSEDRLPAAKQLVEKYYRYYQFIARAASEEGGKIHDEPSRPRSQPHEILDYDFFCRLVGWSEATQLSHTEAKALYRRAAAKLHPDVGGSSEKMASLNAAWRAIRDTLA